MGRTVEEEECLLSKIVRSVNNEVRRSCVRIERSASFQSLIVLAIAPRCHVGISICDFLLRSIR